MSHDDSIRVAMSASRKATAWCSILERGSAEQVFEDPQEERTQKFLSRVLTAGRL